MSTTTFNSIGDRVNITGLLAAPDSSWHSLDLSAYVPVGATAAIIEINNTGSSTAGVWNRNGELLIQHQSAFPAGTIKCVQGNGL